MCVCVQISRHTEVSIKREWALVTGRPIVRLIKHFSFNTPSLSLT